MTTETLAPKKLLLYWGLNKIALDTEHFKCPNVSDADHAINWTVSAYEKQGYWDLCCSDCGQALGTLEKPAVKFAPSINCKHTQGFTWSFSSIGECSPVALEKRCNNCRGILEFVDLRWLGFAPPTFAAKVAAYIKSLKSTWQKS